mmetsp:Transcript_35782/g.111939  ORF Transcript_35782/g.111939 Transcript_35782/m.111939 type:complete len:241 (-) Transcript_35782:901-1623(-)
MSIRCSCPELGGAHAELGGGGEAIVETSRKERRDVSRQREASQHRVVESVYEDCCPSPPPSSHQSSPKHRLMLRDRKPLYVHGPPGSVLSVPPPSSQLFLCSSYSADEAELEEPAGMTDGLQSEVIDKVAGGNLEVDAEVHGARDVEGDVVGGGHEILPAILPAPPSEREVLVGSVSRVEQVKQNIAIDQTGVEEGGGGCDVNGVHLDDVAKLEGSMDVLGSSLRHVEAWDVQPQALTRG